MGLIDEFDYADTAMALSRSTSAESSDFLRVGWKRDRISGYWEKIVLDLRNGRNRFVVKVVEGPNAGRIKTLFPVDSQPPLQYLDKQLPVLSMPPGAID